MNVKSMLVGFLIAVVASTGTYFLVPPPSDAEAERCCSGFDFVKAMNHVIQGCEFQRGGGDANIYRPVCSRSRADATSS